MRHLPNLLTLLRLFAAPFLAWLIVEGSYRSAIALVAFAGVTDWFDGFTARKLGVAGRSGVILDPLADKVLLVTLFFALAYAGLLPLWLLGLVMGRDLVIVTGALLLRMLRNVRKFVPSMLGKVSTFFQIVFVLLVLLWAAWPLRLLAVLKMLSLILTTIFTAWSGVGYVRLGVVLWGSRPTIE